MRHPTPHRASRRLAHAGALLAALALLLAPPGCKKDEGEKPAEGAGGEEAAAAEGEAAEKKAEPCEVELVYVEWASETASTHVVQAVLEDELGCEVEITPVSAAVMWQAIASGDADGMVAGWLPTTHGHYLKKVEDKVEDLGANLEGTRIGLVVPAYVTIDSIEELAANAEKFDGRIVGIDPGAGIMSKTEKAIETYGMGEAIELIEGSGAAMTAALKDAIANEEWIAVTGWTPHWKFARWELKYLKDPKNVYGGEEEIHTVVREGLAEDMPRVHAFLDAFQWTPGDMQTVMAWNQEKGAKPADTARRWLKEHPDRVKAWLGK